MSNIQRLIQAIERNTEATKEHSRLLREVLDSTQVENLRPSYGRNAHVPEPEQQIDWGLDYIKEHLDRLDTEGADRVMADDSDEIIPFQRTTPEPARVEAERVATEFVRGEYTITLRSPEDAVVDETYVGLNTDEGEYIPVPDDLESLGDYEPEGV